MGDNFAGKKLYATFKRIKPKIETLRVRGGWKLVVYHFPECYGGDVVKEWVFMTLVL